MNIVFVTLNDYIYLPAFFHRLLRRIRPDDHITCVLVPPLYKNENLFSASLKFVNSFGLMEFLFTGFEIGWKSIISRVSPRLPGSPVSVPAAFRERRYAVYLEKGDINSPDSLERLRKWKTDLIISISCTQLFGPEFCTLPSKGCLNLHGALLPQYRGIMPSFWMMKNGETKGGVTLHFANNHIDRGDILIQEVIPMNPHESLRDYIFRSKMKGVEVVLRGIEMVRSGDYQRLPMPESGGSYWGWPTREAVREFLASGKRLR